MHKFLFYNKCVIFLYMFWALLCSSSGGQNCIIQHPVSSHSVGGRPVRRLREEIIQSITKNNNFPQHLLLKLNWQILHKVNNKKSSKKVLSQPAHRTVTYRVWRYQMLYNTVLTSQWWTQQHSKHVEEYNKLIIKQEFVH